MATSKIRIYQIDIAKDGENVVFSGLVSMRKRTGKDDPDSSIYDMVWEEETEKEDLEDLYDRFNNDLPDDYDARDMSVSDVVEVVESDVMTPGFYYCDSIGFAKVNFNPDAATVPCREKEIRLLSILPGKKPEVVVIEKDLSVYQKAVDGYIECIYPFDDPVAIIANEEGKINGMKLNRALRDDNGDIYDIVAGPMLIAGCDRDDFRSLTDAEIEKYSMIFKTPEMFIYIGGKIHVLPC